MPWLLLGSGDCSAHCTAYCHAMMEESKGSASVMEMQAVASQTQVKQEGNAEQSPKISYTVAKTQLPTASDSTPNAPRPAACPIARNAALLRELDIAETKVAELLDVAVGALDELSAGVGSLDRTKVDEANKNFLRLVSEVHGCLAPKAEWIRDYMPYPRSIYGPRKELELLHEKADFLRFELVDMARAEVEFPVEGNEGTEVGTVAESSGLVDPGVRREAEGRNGALFGSTLEQGTAGAAGGDGAATPMDIG